MNKIFQLMIDNPKSGKPLNVVKNEAEASLYIYDVIDEYYGISSAAVRDAISNLQGVETLNVFINSPGGSVFEGRAIMAVLQRFSGKKIAHIDSLCASAATSVALACDEVHMLDGSFFMIHNASSLVWGDKNAMRDTAALLEKIETSIVDDYANKTGLEREMLVAMMDEETWMTASEAKANGFVDVVKPSPSAPKNAWNLSSYEKAPKALKQEPENATEQQPVGTSTTNANRLKLATSL